MSNTPSPLSVAERKARRAEQSRLCRARKKSRVLGLSLEQVLVPNKKIEVPQQKSTITPRHKTMSDAEKRARRAEQSRLCRARKRNTDYKILDKKEKDKSKTIINNDVIFAQKVGRDFNEYFHTFSPKLMWFVNNIVNDKDDAEDVVSRAFTKALENIEKYDPKYEFSTWLFTIARKMSLQVLKDRKRYVRIGDESDDEDGHRASVTIQGLAADMDENMMYANGAHMVVYDNEYKSEEKARLILDCISKLPKEQHRRVAVMRELEDMSYLEISEKLGINLSTIKSQIRQYRMMVINMVKDKFAELDEHY